jgi:hypothetical protein
LLIRPRSTARASPLRDRFAVAAHPDPCRQRSFLFLVMTM